MENKIMAGLEEWQKKEQLMKNIFSPDVMQSAVAIKIKLAHYRDVFREHGDTDKLMGQMLRAEIRNLEKHLYPNWIVRNIERVEAVLKSRKEKNIDVQHAKSFVPLLKIKTPAKPQQDVKKQHPAATKEQRQNLLPKKKKTRTRKIAPHL